MDAIPEGETSFFGALGTAIYEQMQLAEEKGLSWDRYGRIAAYCCSSYALVCFMTALSLNRIMVLAAPRPTRRHGQSLHQLEGSLHDWSQQVRRCFSVFLRWTAIAVLGFNLYRVLVALNVQRKIGTPEGKSWWFLHLLHDGLFAYDPQVYAESPFMGTPNTKVMVGPSSEVYWPIFLSVCYSLLVETFVSVTNGKKPYSESLITLFELSVAFHSDDSGYGIFGMRRPVPTTEQSLMLSFFSILSYLNIHIGALVNNNRTRLIPSSIISLAFLAYLVARVPFFSILWLSFIPQVIIVGVLLISVTIFLVAIIGTGFQWRNLDYTSFLFPEDSDNSATQALAGLTLEDDFTMGILKLGELALISAGKLSYVSEIGGVPASNETWIEKSLWEKFGDHVSALKNRSSSEIIQLLEHATQHGYGNMIENPSSTWMYDEEVTIREQVPRKSKDTTLLRKKYSGMKQLAGHLMQLVYGLVVDKSVQPVFRKVLGKEYNEPRLPRYLEAAVNPELGSDEETSIEDSIVDTNAYSADELLEFIDRPWAENDESGDYFGIESELESELESDDPGDVGEVVDAQFLTDLTQPDFANIFRYRLQYDGILTRSRFNKQTMQKDDGTKLIELLMERKNERDKRSKKDTNGDSDSDDDIPYPCVVCQINPREFISWPCRCFSVCGSCRINLATKGMDGCVCCRRHVEGVTKVYIP
ncbi:Protein ASI3 [Meyerozyma sp. JA9]|nr:Protein ASI3 [Meyerozyma sp. JA9]